MKKYLGRLFLLASIIGLSGLFAVGVIPASAVVPGNVTLLSEGTTALGTGGNGHSGSGGSYGRHHMSGDGRYAIFGSSASDLVSGDTNGLMDVFVRNIAGNTTQRVNISTAGVEANDISEAMYISETGRYALFQSKATNLIDGQTLTSNYRGYIRDLKNGTTEIASPNSANIWTYESISADGRFLLLSNGFSSAQNRVILYDRLKQATIGVDNPISGGYQNVSVSDAQMSCDGSFVVFRSAASNLTSSDTNGLPDIFLADLRNGISIFNVTQSSNNTNYSPSISCNGNFVTFVSTANNLVSGTTGNITHVYVYNRITGDIHLADQSTSGTIGNLSVSSWVNPGVDNFGNSVFLSTSTNLASGHNNANQMYFRNNEASTTEILSTGPSGTSYGASSNMISISADGRRSIFVIGDSSGLLMNDTNGYTDVVMAETGF